MGRLKRLIRRIIPCEYRTENKVFLEYSKGYKCSELKKLINKEDCLTCKDYVGKFP